MYTIKVCTNEENFPKRYRWCVANEIVKSSTFIHRSIREANEIFVKDESDYLLRKELQNRALATIGGLLGDMDIAFELYGVDSRRMYYWTGLVIEVQNLVRNWKKSDEKRFKK